MCDNYENTTWCVITSRITTLQSVPLYGTTHSIDSLTDNLSHKTSWIRRVGRKKTAAQVPHELPAGFKQHRLGDRRQGHQTSLQAKNVQDKKSKYMVYIRLWVSQSWCYWRILMIFYVITQSRWQAGFAVINFWSYLHMPWHSCCRFTCKKQNLHAVII